MRSENAGGHVVETGGSIAEFTGNTATTIIYTSEIGTRFSETHNSILLLVNYSSYQNSFKV